MIRLIQGGRMEEGEKDDERERQGCGSAFILPPGPAFGSGSRKEKFKLTT